MSNGLGLSIGQTNLVAVPAGRPPVSRRAILTLFSDRPAEVGIPTQPGGLVLTGFVERVGDPIPLVASDGSAHRGEAVLAEALDAMARTAGGGSPVVVAAPAHWGMATIGTLSAALRGKPGLAAAPVVSDAAAALAGLKAESGLPTQGVVALCDFGGSGTSVTIADAASLTQIGETVRYPEFSGDLVDQALLNHVIAGITESSDSDPAGTAAVGSLAQLRDQCRQAKERLSSETATSVDANMPGFTSALRLTRPELERLMEPALAGVLGVVQESLQRNQIPLGALAAVATVGGGASIPIVTQRLSEYFRVPVVTSRQPALTAAAGAPLVDQRTIAADAPTGMAPTMGWVAPTPPIPPAADLGRESSTVGPSLAWSDDAPGGDVAPYTGGEYPADYPTGFADGSAGGLEGEGWGTSARPAMEFAHEEEDNLPDVAPLAWYRRPPLLFGAAAAAFLITGGSLAAINLTSKDTPSGPVTVDVTTTITGADGNITTTKVPATTSVVTQTDSNGQVNTSTVTNPITTTTTTDTPTTTTTTDSSTTTTTSSNASKA